MYTLVDLQWAWIEGWHASFAAAPQLNPYVHTHESSPDKVCLACKKRQEYDAQYGRRAAREADEAVMVPSMVPCEQAESLINELRRFLDNPHLADKFKP